MSAPMLAAFPDPETTGADAAETLADLLEMTAAWEAERLPLPELRRLTTGQSRYAALRHAYGAGGALRSDLDALSRLFDALVASEVHPQLGWCRVTRHGVFTRAELDAPWVFDEHNRRWGGRTPGQRG